MSVIRASVTDQVLKVTEAPVVASGGQNEVKITFTFCEKWDGCVKTAIFYRDEENVFYGLLDEENTCVVPWEVCYENGTFYIGVFGDRDNTRRTSTVVRYRVKKGAITEDTVPTDPTPDVYNQIVELINTGKLKGEKGDKGDPGNDGTSIAVKSVSESTTDGGSNVVTFSDGKTITIKNGSKGSKGDKGDKGDTGAKGETGAQGAKGDKGDRGIQGVQGEKGDKGEKGDTGDTGVQGIQGVKGDKGDTGADGITPHIGDNGNWFIGEEDTGVSAGGSGGSGGATPDWNATEAESGHILNRTHYMKPIQLLAETTLTLDEEYGCFFLPDNINLVVGQEYIVNWNGVNYICTAFERVVDSERFIALGNWAIADDTATPTSEPFLVAEVQGSLPPVYSNDGVTNLTISIHINAVHRLDNKYLDMYWIPTNVGAVILPEQTVVKSTAGICSIGAIDAQYRVNGTPILVYINGVPYETEICESGSDIFASVTLGINSSATFFFSNSATNIIYANLEGYSVKICLREYNKIPENHLPDKKALTFTGAVNATYDGSSAVSVEIPSGGSGGGSFDWEYINTLELTEDITNSTVEITKDFNGNSFAYKEWFVVVRAQAPSGSSALLHWIPNSSWGTGETSNSIAKVPDSYYEIYTAQGKTMTLGDGSYFVFQSEPYRAFAQSGSGSPIRFFSTKAIWNAFTKYKWQGSFAAGSKFILFGRNPVN